MTAPAIRVLHALRIMNRAGIETWLMHLLRHFDRREVAMDFLVQTEEPGAYDEEIRSLGAPIIPCLRPSRPWRYAQNLKRILRESGPYDVVHSHNYLFSGLDLRVAAQAGVPRRIAHIHPYRDIEAGRPFRGLYRNLMTGWIQKYGTCVLAPSQASLEAFHRVANPMKQPSGVIWNAVDLSSYRTPFNRDGTRQSLGLPLDKPLIVYVARFAPHKNHDFLIPVADRLKTLGISAHFAAAGSEGLARLAFQRRCATRSDFSVFLNPPDIGPLLRCADLFLFPSTEEGFGTVAIEAAAAGLPVVASDLPAIREACAPSHREFMFPPNNAEAAAARVIRILTNPALRAKLGQEAKHWSQQFSIETTADELSAIYRAGFPDPLAHLNSMEAVAQ